MFFKLIFTCILGKYQLLIAEVMDIIDYCALAYLGFLLLPT